MYLGRTTFTAAARTLEERPHRKKIDPAAGRWECPICNGKGWVEKQPHLQFGRYTRPHPAEVEPEPDPRNTWRQCQEFQRIEGFLTELAEHGTWSGFAARCVDAHQAGDQEWLQDASGRLRRLVAYLTHMKLAADDLGLAEIIAFQIKYRDDIGEAPEQTG